MGRALTSNLRVEPSRHPPFAVLYDHWRALVDIMPEPQDGEGLADFEGRADALGARFRATEAALLTTEPAGVAEMIALLEVIRGDETLDPAIDGALANLQRALGLRGLQLVARSQGRKSRSDGVSNADADEASSR